MSNTKYPFWAFDGVEARLVHNEDEFRRYAESRLQAAQNLPFSIFKELFQRIRCLHYGGSDE